MDVNPIEAEPEPFFNAETDTGFLLFTRSNPTVAQRITWTSASVQNSNFNSAHPVRIMIHGFNSGPGNSVRKISTDGDSSDDFFFHKVVTASRGAYIQHGDFNVIA